MSALLHKIGILLVFPLFALAFFLGAYFFFYRGGYDAPQIAEIPFDNIVAPTSSYSTFTEVPELRPGLLLVDRGHRNDFDRGEISTLLARVSDRGHDIEFVGDASTLTASSRLAPDTRLALLGVRLRQADSLAVILPGRPFSVEEVDLVEDFVAKGGRLLLVSDPTRNSEINSLAEQFGINFQPDHLFNTKDYDLNFQNIFIQDFRPDEITEGLGKIALYTAGSVKSSRPGLAYTDANTRSSLVETVEPHYPIAKGGDGRVLAVYDLTFMVPPQDSILDNDRLIANIADYLTRSERLFDLADFPFFLQNQADILLGRSSLFDEGTRMKVLLSDFQIESEIVGAENIGRDTVFLGLYDDAPDVAQYLEVAGIRIDDSVRTPFTPAIGREGTAFIFLHAGVDRHVLIILGGSEAALDDIVGQLDFGDFRAGLVSEFLAVYQTP